MDPELFGREQSEALNRLVKARNKEVYYDSTADRKNAAEYYKQVDFNKSDVQEQMHLLLKESHIHQVRYAPHLYVYPWVDLQEDGNLKSIYSGKKMDPAEAINRDIELLSRLSQSGQVNDSAEFTFNCEHVVPQSWFGRHEPMRGDVHHLFSCEPFCNSMRGNAPYHDFPSYSPEGHLLGIREGCGMLEESKFEPEYGKGIVSRAMLYFFIRYPNELDKKAVNFSVLLDWHFAFKVNVYEKHRNAAIFEIQGNRNPFIDFPEEAESMIENV